jgi:hypothetical protein
MFFLLFIVINTRGLTRKATPSRLVGMFRVVLATLAPESLLSPVRRERLVRGPLAVVIVVEKLSRLVSIRPRQGPESAVLSGHRLGGLLNLMRRDMLILALEHASERVRPAFTLASTQRARS